jgi:hypothetical protein
MPTIIQSIQGRDIGFLRIVARFWGVELVSNDTHSVAEELAAALLTPRFFIEMIGSLTANARSALEELAKADGKLSWADFSRRYGEIREAGPGRRDREEIYLQPASVSEELFYRSLLGRAFFDRPAGAQEFAYIPDDLIPLVPLPGHGKAPEKMIDHHKSKQTSTVEKDRSPMGRLASLKEREQPLPVSDRILDDATTYLAALRMGFQAPETIIPVHLLKEFLSAAQIVVNGTPQIEPVRHFLESTREEALEQLVIAWLNSQNFNELHLVPGLVCEGDWSNQPRATREFLVGLVEAIPRNRWWSLAAFIHSIKEKYPDFQRLAGDYDSWFIKRLSDGVYLRGFGAWDHVEGALIRFLITGPLYWLGQVELATPEVNKIVSAFRVVQKDICEKRFIHNSTVNTIGKLHVSTQGKVIIPRSLSRATRYQVARFCVWDAEKPDEYRYQITTGSLMKAVEQGLKVNQLLGLLAKNSNSEIPPALIKAIKRWEDNGTEARLEVQTVLRVNRPEVLNELRQSKAGRFLRESLGPVTVIIESGAQSKVLAALADLGLLAEDVNKG